MIARVVAVALVAALGGTVAHLGRLSLPWPLVHDAPIMHYIAWRIGQGAVPYRDLFDMNFPGTYLLHLAVLRGLGPGDSAWRAFDLGWLALTALAIAALAAPWGALASAGGALFFAAYHLGGGAWQAGQRDFLLCLFLLLGVLGVARWSERDDRRALLGAGLALGAGLTIKPYAALLAAALALTVCFAPGRADARWRSLGAFVAGSAIVPAAVVTWLAAAGGLGAWWSILTGYLPVYARLVPPEAWVVYRWKLWLPIAFVLGVSVLSTWLARRWTLRHSLALIGLGYGLVHFVVQMKGWEYHLYPLAAFAAVLLCGDLQKRLGARAFSVGLPVAAALALLVVWLWRTGDVVARSGWIADKAVVVRTLTDDLAARRRPGDTVQVLDTTNGGVHALLRLGARGPTRFLYDFHFFHHTGEPVIQALRAELVSGLEGRPPRFIVLFRRGWPDGGEERIREFPALRRLLAERYAVTIARPEYVVHAQRDGS